MYRRHARAGALRTEMERRVEERVLVAGDDTTDETMFALTGDGRDLITVHVGETDTRAAYRLPTPAAFRAFLTSLLPTV